MSKNETATGFARRVSGASAAIKSSQRASGRSIAENAAKRAYGALRGEFEHNSFDTAVRRHHAAQAIRLRRYANKVLLLVYAAAGALLFAAHTLLKHAS